MKFSVFYTNVIDVYFRWLEREIKLIFFKTRPDGINT
jgi:hypothetical protein